MNQKFPNSPFELHQPFMPAGDQPKAIEQLTHGIDAGEKFQTLLGVTGSGKTYTIANVIAKTGRPAIVMAPNKTLAAQLYSEFREFFPNNAVFAFIFPFGRVFSTGVKKNVSARNLTEEGIRPPRTAYCISSIKA